MMLASLLLILVTSTVGTQGFPQAPNPKIGRPRILLYKQYKAQQNWVEALETMRKEIRDPLNQNAEYLLGIRIIAISALANYADFYGLQAGIDQEALRYYQEGLKFAKKGEQEAQLNAIMSIYYSKTSRNGMTLPYMRKEGDYYRKVNNTYMIIKNYDGLASCYNDMGQLELRDHYRKTALDLAKTYFVLGKRPTNANEWLQFEKMLEKQMDSTEGPGAKGELMNLWSIAEPIVKKYISPEYLSYQRMAKRLASSGETTEAKEFLDRAKQIAEKEKHRFSEKAELIEMDLAGANAQLCLYAGDYEKGIREMERFFNLASSKNFNPDPGAFRIAALLYEGRGDYDRAIQHFRQSIGGLETTRSSFSVAERVTFFNKVPRKSYWGLIRCLTKKGLKNKSDGDLLEALQSTELVRGRSFGEILDEQTAKKTSIHNLEELSGVLNKEDLLLDYIFMDREIVLFAFAKDLRAAFILPYNQQEFSRQTVSLIRNLSDPTSDLGEIHRQLVRLSKMLLSPVRDIIDRKKRIVVLPDGLLNAVPFDLLSLEDASYRPIIAEKDVVTVPSLRYLLHAWKERPRVAGLFAMADPAYSRSPEIQGLSTGELKRIDRGSKYQRYFSPLPETRTEVEAIASMYKGEPVLALYGREARKSALKEADLKSFGYLHFATHGILGGDVPGVDEPALVLAQEKEEDGFLRASEVEKLQLNADLAVLSACNTGTGKYFTGEGVMGISRSFLLAGSRSVVVSLWSVPSKETELLMVNFYRNLRSGIDAPAALRKAKSEMMKMQPSSVNGKVEDRGIAVREKGGTQEQSSHPFFWASFILFGGI